MGMQLNFGSILKLAMWRAQAYKDHKYAFGDLITELCSRAGVPADPLDYCPHIEATPCIVSAVQESEPRALPTLTTADRAHRDKLVIACMFGMQPLMLRMHCSLIIPKEIVEVEIQ